MNNEAQTEQKPQSKFQRDSANNANTIRNAAEVASKVNNPYAKAIGEGVKIADNLTGGKSSEMLGKAMTLGSKLNVDPMSRGAMKLGQKASNFLSESGLGDRIGKAAASRNATQNARAINAKNAGKKLPTSGLSASNDIIQKQEESTETEGVENFKVSTQTKKRIIFACIPIFLIMIFCCLFISASQTMLSVYGIGSADEASAKNIDEKIGNTSEDDLNEEKSDDDVATSYNVTISRRKYATPYFLAKSWTEQQREHNEADLSELEDFFGGSLRYDETSNMNTVHNFYFKLHDIYVRYSMKTGVELDLPLLMSTLMMESKNMNTIFESNTKEKYDRKNLETIESHILDYSHDWSGYRIIDNDSSHDIEILAQNMISLKDDGTYELDYDKYDEFLNEFLEKKYFIEGGGLYTGSPEISNGGTCDTTFTKYELTDDQLKQIASLAYHEQGTPKGASAEASLMANLFEIKGSKYGEGANGLYNYIRTSGWFANSEKFMDSKDASDEIVNAVKSVLVDGKRTLPAYIDEHDMFGDITSVETDGNKGIVSDRTSYTAFKTKIKNRYGSQYTFYSFPDKNSDPFGYTSEKIREEKGEFYFDFETGQPQNCESNSSGGTDLSSAFVSLAVSQLNDPSKNGGQKYWRYMGFKSRVAWCASFVSWNIYNTEYNGQKLSDIISHKSAAVDSFMNYFHNNKNPNIKFYYNDNCSKYAGKNGNNNKYIPKEGDLIFFDNTSKWNGSFPVSRSNLPNRHIGIVQYAKDGQVTTIEGNSGDKTKENKFSLSSCRIIGFGSWY